MVAMCLEHGKPRELICVKCRKKCCDTCALFGSHRGHDVRQQNDTMTEIQLRTEVLMEMYQQLEQEAQVLVQMDQLQKYKRLKETKEQELKDQVTLKIREWQALLSKLEAEAHGKISHSFQTFDVHFDEEAASVSAVMETGTRWLQKVCSILDSYTAEIERNPEHIAYELLDNYPLNENTVEALYSEAEEWIARSVEKRKFEALAPLEQDYQRVKVWFKPDFESRLEDVYDVQLQLDPKREIKS